MSLGLSIPWLPGLDPTCQVGGYRQRVQVVGGVGSTALLWEFGLWLRMREACPALTLCPMPLASAQAAVGSVTSCAEQGQCLPLAQGQSYLQQAPPICSIQRTLQMECVWGAATGGSLYSPALG